MKCISIDIESFSDVDLSKCGVYKYSSSPNFEILLFGYSVDGGDVEVVDLACGEEIPAEILAALSDESVTKWAFNAMFERVCLSNYLGEWLEPESWKCSMVWSATLGLPLSLENVGAVLGLEKQKLTEGKDLIRYFCVPCKPTKANGGRTRNLPGHDREKWERFKAYNFRDVEAEMQIQQRLVKFPVPDFVWEEYRQDQEINDRGIAMGRKGPNFFYVYNDQYHYFEVFEEFATAEELEKLIIGTMAENMETFNAVALENTQKMFDDLDINENVGNYDPEFHIYKLLRQMEIMTGQLEHWSELMAGTYRSFANVCKDVKFDREKPGEDAHE